MKNVLVIFIVCALCSGCSSYAFSLDSDPGGADISIIDSNKQVVYTAKTPAKVASRHIPKGKYVITLNKAGYKELVVFRENSEDSKIRKINLGKRNLEKVK